MSAIASGGGSTAVDMDISNRARLDFHKNNIKNKFLKNIFHANVLKQAGEIFTRTLLERIFRVEHFTKYSQTFVKNQK